MKNTVKISRPPIDKWDMEKVLKILKKDINVTVNGNNPAEKNSIMQEQAIFRFVSQILNEKPALLESFVSAILSSNSVLSKYICATGLMDMEQDFDVDHPEESLKVLVSFMVFQAQRFLDATRIPEGTIIH